MNSKFITLPYNSVNSNNNNNNNNENTSSNNVGNSKGIENPKAVVTQGNLTTNESIELKKKVQKTYFTEERYKKNGSPDSNPDEIEQWRMKGRVRNKLDITTSLLLNISNLLIKYSILI
jgi:antitoxin component of MazEF toxin-antitoxin module